MNRQELIRENEAAAINKCREPEVYESVFIMQRYRGNYMCPECYTHNAEWERREKTKHFDIVYCWHCGCKVQLN